MKWFFGTVAGFTDTLLFFLPKRLTHQEQRHRPDVLVLEPVRLCPRGRLITVVGLLARNYFGKRMIEWVDTRILRVPLLNKIYGAIKQVNEAFTSGTKSSFKTVVLVEFPREGIYSVGFSQRARTK